MKATRLKQLGANEPFIIFDKPDVAPGNNCTAVRVHAASINAADTKMVSGPDWLAPEQPIVLGCDFSGVVIDKGPGADKFAIGDEVYGCAGGVKGKDGTYSSRMIADEALVAKKPKTVVA